MRSTSGGGESLNLDRRAFLIGLGSAGLTLASGGVSQATTGHAGSRARAVKGPGAVARGLQQAIRGHVFEPGQPGFNAAAHVYNPRFDGVLPSAVARPIDALDVRSAIRFTVAQGVHVRARSGGTATPGTRRRQTGSYWICAT